MCEIKLIQFTFNGERFEYCYYVFTPDVNLARYISLKLRWDEENSNRHTRYVAHLKNPYLNIEKTLSSESELQYLVEAYYGVVGRLS